MVSAGTILLIGGIAIFLLAGGIPLTQKAFTQAKIDLGNVQTRTSTAVQDLKRTLKRNGVDMNG